MPIRWTTIPSQWHWKSSLLAGSMDLMPDRRIPRNTTGAKFEPHSNLTLGMGTSTFFYRAGIQEQFTLSNKKDRQLRQDILASTLCYEPAFRSTRTIHYRIQVTVPISVHLITWNHEEEKTQGILEDETKKLYGQQQGIKGLGKLKTMHRIVRVGLHSQILQVKHR
ncbi:hypothetical protein BJV77DRAFT_222992 [Russula vinacea]|nr:hypothetical protein BJV77DRAFT_222992 [Russula vinacea]